MKLSLTWGKARLRPQRSADDSRGEVRPPPRVRVSRHTPQRLLAVLASVSILTLALTIACAQRTQALNRVQSSGMLRVAIDPSFPPFESIDSAGQIVGYDVDLARALAQGLGVEAHFVTTGYDALFDALTVGRADVIISALYPDPSRTAGFAFSDPYFNAGEVTVVRERSPVPASGELAGRSVACIFGTAGHMELLRLEDSLDPPPIVITVDDPITITTLLDTGTIDAIVIDHVSALEAVSNSPSLAILTPPLTDEPYSFAVRRDDAGLFLALEKTLSALASNGTLDRLSDAWMGEVSDR